MVAQRHHVTVIGGGIIGACCALALRQDGHEVALVERDELGRGCSYGNAGILTTHSPVPSALPGIWRNLPKYLTDPDSPVVIRWRYLPWILPWLTRYLLAATPQRVERTSLALATLVFRTIESYRQLLPRDDFERLLVGRGLLYTYRTEASFAAARYGLDLRRRRGVAMEVLDGAALRQLEPALGAEHARAVYFPETYHTIDPGDLVRTITARFADSGGEVVKADVRSLTVASGGAIKAETSAGPCGLDRVVIAAGAWSKHLARQCGASIPLDTERGYHMMLPRAGVELRIPIVSSDYGVAVTPMAKGLRVTSTVEFSGVDAPPDFRRAEFTLARARHLFPNLNGDGAVPWMGCRPSVPDTIPVIGPIRGAERVFLACGHGHSGVGFGAVTGLLIRDLVSGRSPIVDPTPFSPSRF